MLSVTSRIWTRVAVSISYDDNHYTMGYKYFFLTQNILFNIIHSIAHSSMVPSIAIYH